MINPNKNGRPLKSGPGDVVQEGQTPSSNCLPLLLSDYCCYLFIYVVGLCHFPLKHTSVNSQL